MEIVDGAAFVLAGGLVYFLRAERRFADLIGRMSTPRTASGVLALARTAKAAQRLTESFRHKDARKIYWAVVVGVPEVRGGRIDAPLQKAGGKGAERVHVDEEGKRAVTEFAVIEKAAAPPPAPSPGEERPRGGSLWA